jgi:hypothetical protein
MMKALVILLSVSLSNGFVPLLSSRSGSTPTTTIHQPFLYTTKARTTAYPKLSSPLPSSALNVATPEALQDAWIAYNNALEVSPLLVKSATAGVILGLADLAGQAIEDIKDGRSVGQDIDLTRTARFAFFGLVLQAVRRKGGSCPK